MKKDRKKGNMSKGGNNGNKENLIITVKLSDLIWLIHSCWAESIESRKGA
jgi:hypothetical protein